VLLIAVVVNFVAILATGRFLAAFLSCFGFFAWWGCADLAAHTVSLARAALASVTRGVHVEAHYVTSEMRPGTSGRMVRTWVYEYTDLDGGVYEYLTARRCTGRWGLPLSGLGDVGRWPLAGTGRKAACPARAARDRPAAPLGAALEQVKNIPQLPLEERLSCFG
jgi:hypothetical protein